VTDNVHLEARRPGHVTIHWELPLKKIEEVRDALNWYINEQLEMRTEYTEDGPAITSALPREWESAVWFAGFLQGAINGRHTQQVLYKTDVGMIDSDHPLAWMREVEWESR
jgi:hypothetical protein